MDLSAIGNLYRDEGRLAAASAAAKTAASKPAAGPSFSQTLAKATDKTTGKPAVDRSSKLYEQCQTLETFVVKNILEGLRKTVQKSELSDTGFAGKMYEDMLYDEYAVSLSKNSGFGLADLAYLELSGQRGVRA